jgi:hypothetical protein
MQGKAKPENAELGEFDGRFYVWYDHPMGRRVRRELKADTKEDARFEAAIVLGVEPKEIQDERN